MSNEAKKEARAARFGLTTSSGPVGGSVGTNIEILKKRAERFGTTLPGSILEKVIEAIKYLTKHDFHDKFLTDSYSDYSENVFRRK